MRENVRNFVEMVADGKDVMIAANETGVIEMNTYDLLHEMSRILAGKQFANTMKSAMESFSNWVEASQALLSSKKTLEDMFENVKEIDNSSNKSCVFISITPVSFDAIITSLPLETISINLFTFSLIIIFLLLFIVYFILFYI